MLDTQVSQSVIDHALYLGADFAELFVETRRVSDVKTLSSEVQSVQSGIDFGIGIRLVYGDKVLYGYTNKTDDTELKRITSELAAKDLRDAQAKSTAVDFRATTENHPATKTLSRDPEVEAKVAYLSAADRPCGQHKDLADHRLLHASRAIR
jgi:TldD protein